MFWCNRVLKEILSEFLKSKYDFNLDNFQITYEKLNPSELAVALGIWS